MNMDFRSIGIAVSMMLGVVACSSDKSTPTPMPATTVHVSPYPACNAIIEACHPLDVGEGPIHDCHNLGHEATSDADCIPKKDECLRICVPESDAGATSGDGGADAG
jgi:hypothetical protein